MRYAYIRPLIKRNGYIFTNVHSNVLEKWQEHHGTMESLYKQPLNAKKYYLEAIKSYTPPIWRIETLSSKSDGMKYLIYGRHRLVVSFRKKLLTNKKNTRNRHSRFFESLHFLLVRLPFCVSFCSAFSFGSSLYFCWLRCSSLF